MILRWKRIGDHRLPVPSRAHDGDAGIDLAVVVEHHYPIHLHAHDGRIGVTANALITFRTGWAVEIPPGWFGLIVVRSSIGKAGWDIESSGVIDSGYRSEIMLPLVFRGSQLDPKRYVSHGDRMAQMLLLPAPTVDCQEVDDLSTTTRGAGGFGST